MREGVRNVNVPPSFDLSSGLLYEEEIDRLAHRNRRLDCLAESLATCIRTALLELAIFHQKEH